MTRHVPLHASKVTIFGTGPAEWILSSFDRQNRHLGVYC